MFVEQKMQLIKRRPGNLPVGLFVEVPQRHGIGEQQIQLLGHLETDRFLQFKRQDMRNRAISLNLPSALVKSRLCVERSSTACHIFLRHLSSPDDRSLRGE